MARVWIRAPAVLIAALLVVTICVACGGGGGGGEEHRTGDDSGPPPEDQDPAQPENPSGAALKWRASAGATGYVVHWGTASGSYPNMLDVGSPAPAADDSVTIAVALDASGTYFFAVSAHDAAGERSAYSNELSLELP